MSDTAAAGEWGRAAGEHSRLLVVGAGLIGTSVALAARAGGYDVWLDDLDRDRLALAVSMGAGLAWRDRHGVPTTELTGPAYFDIAVVAVAPAAVGMVSKTLVDSGVACTITHVASVQGEPQLEVETMFPRIETFVGSHPIAGRERSGPHHASADLFRQRPWIVCPTQTSAVAAVTAVSRLASVCGAAVTVMSAADHDALLAQLSHTPQLVASALAASLVGLDRTQVALAGTGLRDTSRLADSDGELWGQIVAANPAPVAAALRTVVEPLTDLIDALEGPAPKSVTDAVLALLRRGREGRDLLAGKHGQVAVRWATVSVVVPDAPGALARLLVDAADAEVNVEDIRVDHSPGQPFGVVELDVSPGRDDPLVSALSDRGWKATASAPPPD